jgi:ribosomal protein S18 acetylase RimI-like enzyme
MVMPEDRSALPPPPDDRDAHSSDITIRDATTDDVEFLAEVIYLANVERYRDYPDWDASTFTARARAATLEQVQGGVAHNTTSVIMRSGERVGRLRVVRTSDRLEIAGIQLLPAFQRRGIGTNVLRALLREGRQAGLPVVLEVEDDNPQARQLYQRLGFVPYEAGDGCTRMIVRQ